MHPLRASFSHLLCVRDNLEFLQWIKKYWDTHTPGEHYDAEGRRGGAPAVPPPLLGQVSVGVARTGGAARAPAASRAAPAARAPVRAAVGGAARVAPSARNAVPDETILALTSQMDEMKVSVDSLEKERDFYFAKVSAVLCSHALCEQRGTDVCFFYR